ISRDTRTIPKSMEFTEAISVWNAQSSAALTRAFDRHLSPHTRILFLTEPRRFWAVLHRGSGADAPRLKCNLLPAPCDLRTKARPAHYIAVRVCTSEHQERFRNSENYKGI